AGVSKITISRALRDSPLVTPATRARIKALAEQVGYRMNFSARNLRLQRCHTIAVVLEMLPDVDRPMSGPYPLHLLGGIMQELATQGYNLLLTAVQPVVAGLPVAADGVILLGQGVHDAGMRAVADCRLPFVVWGAEPGPGRLDGVHAVIVGSDNRQGGASVARRFIELGRHQPLFLGDTRHAEVRERLLGFRAGLQRASIQAAALRPEAFTFGAGYAAVQAHLRASRTAPDALFAASDLLAMGAVRAFAEAGLAVPEAVSVIGYDDSPPAQTCTPPLSSVSQDWVHGGVLLARKVLELIAGGQARSVTLPTRLVLRAT
ncbi:MAG: substrate-binding domain-containing protein, partial [Burkholderiales bacterium]|nr:substrate-binding domain-containing protein [Burkholderiales bacterium]